MNKFVSTDNLIIIKKFILILFLFFSQQGFTQGWEFGGGLGPSNYLGEIGGVYEPRGFIADLQLKKTRMGFNGFARYNFSDKFSVATGLAHGWIEGADSLSLSPSRFTRNLSFRNQIFEMYTRAEIDLFALEVRKRGGRFRLRFAPYMFAGIGAFYHNPKAFYNGDWHALRPLQTEGVEYSKINLSFPLGGGVSFSIGRYHNFGWEIGWRPTNTDYLDDVSSTYALPSSLNSNLSRTLADRSYEVNPDDERFLGTQYFSEGTQSSPDNPSIRGNSKTNDSFLMSYFTYSFTMPSNRRGFSAKSRYSLIQSPKKKFKKSSYKRKKKRRNHRKFKLFHKKLHPHF